MVGTPSVGPTRHGSSSLLVDPSHKVSSPLYLAEKLTVAKPPDPAIRD